jgi:hypothetical protein
MQSSTFIKSGLPAQTVKTLQLWWVRSHSASFGLDLVDCSGVINSLNAVTTSSAEDNHATRGLQCVVVNDHSNYRVADYVVGLPPNSWPKGSKYISPRPRTPSSITTSLLLVPIGQMLQRVLHSLQLYALCFLFAHLQHPCTDPFTLQ